MARDKLINDYREQRLSRTAFVRRLRATGFTAAGALALAAALAPAVQAGSDFQHNETLVRL